MSDPLRASGLAAELGAVSPLIAAPMAGGPSTPELVVAAQAAGGIGLLAGGYASPSSLAGQSAEVRAATHLFGVNLFVPNPVPVDPVEYRRYRLVLEPWAHRYGVDLPEEPQEDDDAWQDKLQLLLEHPVPLVSFTFGLPEAPYIAELQRAGSTVVQTVTTTAEAQQAEAGGADGLIVQSSQAGGHSGTWTPHDPIAETRTPQLVREVRAVTSVPLWAAGGITTAADVQNVLAAGAEAAVLGTVLLRSRESGASAAHKDALGSAQYSGTVMTRAFSGRPARALRNEFAEAFTASAPWGFPAVHHLTSPLRKAAAAQQDGRSVNLWAGTGYGGASAEPAADILHRLTMLGS